MNHAWRVAGALSILFSALSTFLLVQEGLQFGLAAPLKAMFAFYDWSVRLVAVLLIAPLINGILWGLEVLFDWHLGLRPGWHHLYVAASGFGASMSWATGHIARSYQRIYPTTSPPWGLTLVRILALVVPVAGVLPASIVRSDNPVLQTPINGLLSLAWFAAVLFLSAAWIYWMAQRAGAQGVSPPIVATVDRASLLLVAVPLGTMLLVIMNAGLGLLPNPLP
jgi:hypothetical protein